MRHFSDDAIQLDIPLARLARLLGTRVSSLYRWSKTTKITQGYMLVIDKLELLHSVAEVSPKFRLQTDEEIIERMRKQLTKELGGEDSDEKESEIIKNREKRKLIAEKAKKLRFIIDNRRDVIRQAKEYLATPGGDNRQHYERKLAEFSSDLHAAETELNAILQTGQLPPVPDPTPKPDYTPGQLNYLVSCRDPYIDYDGEQYYRDNDRGGGFYTPDGQPLPPDFWAIDL